MTSSRCGSFLRLARERVSREDVPQLLCATQHHIHFEAEAIGNRCLDLPGEPYTTGLPALEHYVAALQQGLNAGQSDRFVELSQRGHPDALVRAKIDAAQE